MLPNILFVSSRKGVFVPKEPPTSTKIPSIAKRPFHVSASFVSPRFHIGISPMGSSSSSPSSRKSLSWKEKGAMVAAIDTIKTWTWAMRMTALWALIGLPPPRSARVPHCLRSRSSDVGGMSPCPWQNAEIQMKRKPNMAWRPFQVSAFTLGPQPLFANSGYSFLKSSIALVKILRMILCSGILTGGRFHAAARTASRLNVDRADSLTD
mmetsp:Transcript_22251/g.32182  ORF Transcript_22251/g.32182 Transcript_22251/m.32182 type:complete len:209 (+) Transcript_22251:369-995(+)